MHDLTAFVLAGGKSSRMGTDKAFLSVAGSTLLERALQTVRGLTSAVWIVGSRETFERHAPVVEDVFPNCGPLGGIHAALRLSQTELNLVLAVDMPLMDVATLTRLVERASCNGALATVPRIGGRLNPLCAIYRKSFAVSAEEALRRGDNKIDLLFTAPSTNIIEQEELPGDGTAFGNVNTPEDLDRVAQQLAATELGHR